MKDKCGCRHYTKDGRELVEMCQEHLFEYRVRHEEFVKAQLEKSRNERPSTSL